MDTLEPIVLFSAKRANQGLDFSTPVQRVLDRNHYILGEEVKAFESEFAAYVGVGNCISVANGSDALEIALRGLGVTSGDRVITVANAGFYGSTAILRVGATPTYVDIDPTSLTLCSKALAGIIDSNPAAIIVTHLYGQLANIDEIVQIAQSAGVPVLEDCAQAHGARRNGRTAGSFGTIAAFSFYPTKNLGAIGDGGAIVTNDDALAERLRQLRQYGWSRKYEVSLAGGCNSRLDEIQAAVLRVKLPLLDDWNKKRRLIAKRYNDAFARLDVRLPSSIAEDYVAHLYVLRVKNRDGFVAALRNSQIATDIHYPIADHRQPAYGVAQNFHLPVTDSTCETVVSLPCFPGLTDEEVHRVIEAVTTYFSTEV